MVDKDFASIISNKTRHYKMVARAVHNKNHMTWHHMTPHDTRNREDTKGILQVLFLRTFKCVVFLVDISNTRPNF